MHLARTVHASSSPNPAGCRLAERSMMKTLLVAAMVFSAPFLKAASGTPVTNDVYFGFTGPETFPIDPFISELRAADLDGDGLTDLIIANNSRSKITLLYN